MRRASRKLCVMGEAHPRYHAGVFRRFLLGVCLSACELESPAKPPDLAHSPLRITETMGDLTTTSAGEAAPAASTSTVARVPPPRATADAPPVPAPAPIPERPGCRTTCTADSYSPIPRSDFQAVEAAIVPNMRELRACLDRVGAQGVRPVVHLRFTNDGRMSGYLYDVGGFESLNCVKLAYERPPRVVTSRGTTLRCEYRCD